MLDAIAETITFSTNIEPTASDCIRRAASLPERGQAASEKGANNQPGAPVVNAMQGICSTPGCCLRKGHIGLHTCERIQRGVAPTAAAETLQSGYDSVSKKAHRFRIAMEMTDALHSEGCEGVPPRLFLIGAPDKKDVLHFTKMLPRGIDMVSLNRASMDSPLSFQNVTFEECTEALDYLSDAPTGSFTHIWLDLTERECDMKLLFAARRALSGFGRAQLFVTLSTRGVTAEDCSTIITTQLAALGGHVSHYENYRGVNQQGLSSSKRNMVFLAAGFNEVGRKRAMLAGYDSSLNPIGAMAWIAVEERHDNVAVYTFRSGKKLVHTHFGMVSGYTGGVYTVRLFSDRGVLTNTLQVAAPSQLHKVSSWNPKELRAFFRRP